MSGDKYNRRSAGETAERSPHDRERMLFNKRISQIIAALVFLAGCLVLMGWMLDIPVLKSVFPNLATMKANSALCFIMAGAALWLLQDEQASQTQRRLAQVCALAIFLIGSLTLLEYIFGWDFGIDQLFFRDTGVISGFLYPGRMSHATTVSFMLLGLAFWLLSHSRRYVTIHLITLIVMSIALLTLAGYLYEVDVLRGFFSWAPMAIHTGLLFFILGIGILTARPEQGLTAFINSEQSGGKLMRRLLPAVILLPLLFGWVRLRGQELGLYDTHFGLALFALSNVFTFTLLVWWSARSLNQTDIERQKAETAVLIHEKRYHHILDNMLESCEIIGFDWRFQYVNDTAVRYNRLTKDELLGHTVMECYPGIENTAIGAALQRCMQERRIEYIQNEYVFPDGTRTWFEQNIQPVDDGIFILSLDITERKRSEELQSASEIKYRRLFESAKDGILILDASTGRIVDINPYLVELLGYAAEAFTGKKLWEIGAFSDIAASQSAFTELLEKKYVRYEDLPLATSDGRLVNVEFVSNVYWVDDQEVIQCNIRDITFRRQAEQRLKRYAQRMELLHEIDLGLIQGQSIHELVETTLRHLRGLIPCQRATVAVLDRATNEGIIFANNMDGETVLGQGVRVPVMATGMDGLDPRHMRVIDDIRLLQDPNPQAKLLAQEGLVSSLEIVLMEQNTPIGALGLLANTPNFFTAEYREIADQVGSQLALAIHQLYLSESLKTQVENLRKTEIRYRSVVEDQTELICRYDTDFKLTFMNRAYQERLGIFPHEMSNLSLLERIPVEQREGARQHVRSLNATNPVAISEHQSMMVGGAVRWIQWTDRALLDDNGNVIEYQGVGRDVTDQREREAEQERHRRADQEMRQFLQTTFDAFPASAAVLDGNGVIISVNAGWERFADENDAPSYYENLNYLTVCDSAVDSPEAPQTAAGIRAVISGRQDHFFLEYPCPSPSEKRWFGLRVTPFDEPPPRRVVVAHINITERKLAEEALLEAYATLEERIVERTAELGESEAKFRSLLDAAPMSTIITDQAGIITLVNIQAEALFGYHRDELVGQPVEMLVPENVRQQHVHDWDDYMAAPRVRRMPEGLELFGHHKDGTLIPVEIEISQIKTQSGLLVMSFIADITERKERERQLRFHASLQQNVTDAVIATDLDYIVQSWNPAAEKIYGWKAEEIVGKPVTILRSQFLSNDSAERVRQSFLDHGYWTDEVIQHHKDGTAIYILSSVVLFKDNKGQPFGMVAVNHDITERKMQEQKLRYYASIQESVSDAVISTDLELHIQSWNKAAERIYGWSAEEAIGQISNELLHIEFVSEDARAQALRQLTEYGSAESESIQHHKDGTPIHILGSVVALRDENDKHIGFLAVNHDITGRKQAENALRESELRYRLLAENITDVIEKLDINGIRTFITPSCFAQTGYTPEELVGSLARDILYPDDLDSVRSSTLQAMSASKSTFTFTARIIHKDGHIVWTESTGNIVLDPSTGKLVEIILVIRDISARIHAEEALNARMEDEREFQEYLKALHEITIELTQIDDLNIFYKRTVELGLERLGFERLGLFLYDEKDGAALGTYGTDAQGNLSDERGVRFVPDANGPMQHAFERAERFYFEEETTLYTDLQATGSGWNVAAVLWNGTQSLGWFIADNLLSHKPASKALLDIIGLYALSVATLLAQKQSQMSLRESEARYRLLAENVTDVIVRMKPDGTRTFVSPSCYVLLSYTPEELVGPNGLDIVHPEDVQKTNAITLEAIKSSQPSFSITQRVRHKAGHYVWVEATNSIVRDPTGNVMEFIGVFRDITERKRTEEILRQSEERFASVFRFSPVAIGLTTAAEGRYLDVNDSLLNLLGYSRDEIIGRTASELNVWDAPDQRVEAVRSIRENGSVSGLELRFRKKTGELCTTLTSITTVILNDQSCLLSIVYDITERKRAEEALNTKMQEEREFQVYLKVLNEISIELTQIDDLDTFYRRSVEMGLERFGFERFGLLIYDSDQNLALGTYGTDAQGKLVAEHHLRFDPSTPTGLLSRAMAQDERFSYEEQAELFADLKPIGRGWNAVAALWKGSENLGWIAADNAVRHSPASKPLLDILSLYALTLSTLLVQKQSQIALRESEGRYRLLAENITDVVVRSNSAGEYLYVSPSSRNVLGYDPEELVGKSSFADIHPDDLASAIQSITSSADQSINMIVRFHHKEGHYIWMETIGSPIYSETGEIEGLITSSRDISDRKRAEESLRESEAKFRLLLDAAPVATIITDQLGRISLVNLQAEILFGYTRTELEGKMIEVLMPDYLRDRHIQNRIAYMEQPRVRQMGIGLELFAKRKDASEFPVEIELSYIDTTDGMMVMSFIVDITERKRAAAELEGQRTFLRSVIDVSPSMIFVKDYESRFVLANSMVARMYDTTVDELIGKTDHDFNPSVRESDSFLEADRQVITSGEPLFIEESITNYRNETLWFQTTKVPIISADGNSKHVLGIATEITERKRSEAALKESEEKYRSLIETMRGGLAIYDLDERITYINDRFLEILGYSRDEVIGTNAVDYVDTTNLPALESQIERRRRAESSSYELLLRHKSGSPVHMLISGSPLLDKNGKLIGSFAVTTDITAQKQAEETLLQSLEKEKELNELKTRFVSMASHEFRTPLATILALTETLRAYRHRLPDEQIEQRLLRIQDQIGHLNDIMEDVLMLARMQARRVEFNPVKMNLDSLCRSVLDEFESRPDMDHRLNYHCDDRLHEVWLDKKLMRQIINNLVSNALKYSLPDKTINIDLAYSEDNLIFQVQDQGIGIPEADLKHLFEPFHRAGNVGTISGTGLGLVIAKDAIELHGGTITVESEIGMGTTFTVMIPLSSKEGA